MWVRTSRNLNTSGGKIVEASFADVPMPFDDDIFRPPIVNHSYPPIESGGVILSISLQKCTAISYEPPEDI